MNERRADGWRFVHPDLDRSDGNAGIRLHPRGGVATVGGAAAVRQSVLMLLSTRRGERVMRPEYGCDLHELVFAPCDGTTAGLALHYVRQALGRWEPRAKVVRLDANFLPERPGTLMIQLTYEVRSTGTRDELAVALDLAGEGA